MPNRRQNDFYPTPEWATQYLLENLPFPIAAPWAEPCVGDGAIADLLRQRFPVGVTADSDSQHKADVHGDACKAETWNQIESALGSKPAWVITNPPFVDAASILPMAMERATHGVIALLRITYLEPCSNRSQWLEEHQDNLSILFLPRRVSFLNNGKTDSATTAWFIWGKQQRLAPPFIYPKTTAQQLSLIAVRF